MPVRERETSAPRRALARLGLLREIDLALHLPLRYEDETRVVPLAGARPGETVQLEGTVTACRVQAQPRRQLVVNLDCDGEPLLLRFLHFAAAQQKSFAVGRRLRVRGELRGGFLGRELVHPVVRPAESPLPAALTPVYPASAQLPQPYLRKAIASALATAPLAELLPPAATAGLPSLREALEYLHRPPPGAPLAALEDRSHPAWQRLKFDELLAQQLSQREARAARERLGAPALADPRLAERLRAALPFRLTAAQERVVGELARDLEATRPMHRLLQGDVGSGKTVVAALAAAIAVGSGWQCALMAPTELLAEQHWRKLVDWLAPLGLEVAWLAGGRRGAPRRRELARIAAGEAAVVVGTHAVIEDDVSFARLGLAIVDEQHRFGVAQRLALRAKLGADDATRARLEPHLLMMSATPIPRTLAMTYFADLDVSTIDELPPGRTPVLTKLFVDDRRAAVVAHIRAEVERGRQAYWVCPLVEESEHLDLQNATATHVELAAALGGARVALLHGRMAAADKAAAMAGFADGSVQVLVATTVIEVGVDVPNASLMVIEHAERFGLAQLHQLRGRVGRGSAASVCVLLYSAPLAPAAKERLRAMLETADGFEIARRDLEIRGPGEFLGLRQSGDALLRFADPGADAALLERARTAARRLAVEHPEAARAQVERWLGGRAGYARA